jgi:hypothetical protein
MSSEDDAAVGGSTELDTRSESGAGIVELSELLRQMAPVLDDRQYVFCTVPGGYAEYADLNPLCSFVESEGLTLILDVATAEQAQMPVDATYSRITLTVHSSLEAVGLTAAVATALTAAGISANVVAAYYHDHVFVQSQQADKAMAALQQLVASQRSAQ